MLKPRILFILPNLSAGGAERNILSLVRRFAPDFEVHLALIQFTGGLLSELPDDVRLHALHGRLQFPFRFIALARRLRPCVVLSTIVDVNLAMLALRRFLPRTTCLVIRDAVMPLDLSRDRWYAFVSRYVWRQAYANADAVIVLTERCRRATVEELNVSKYNVFLIRNAVSETRVAKCATLIRDYKDTINLVSIGRLERQKGYDLLIQSLPRVLQRYPNVRLTIFGEGRERPGLLREIGRLGLENIVTLAGHVTDPIPFLSCADLFVLCSRFEGMSNAMLEALYCGVPVLATNNRENSADEFIIDGKNGFLVPACTVEQITQGLLRALDKCWVLDKSWICRDAKDRFSLARYEEGYIDVFERLCFPLIH